MCWPDTVVFAYNLSTSDFWVQDQPTLHTNFQGSHSYKVRSYLRQWEKKIKKIKQKQKQKQKIHLGEMWDSDENNFLLTVSVTRRK